MDTLLSVMVGVGLAAACGFRVFVPLLVLSVAAQTGHMELAHGFAWLGSKPATIAFGVATLIEIAGYYIPWVDHLLDVIAAPTAVVAGTLVTASSIGHASPFLHWSLALLAGGGTAAVFQGLTTAARGVSTLTTGGFGNPVVSTVEAAGSALLSVLAIAVPVLTVLALVLLLYFGVKKIAFRRRPVGAT
jgi:hypothetical protein